VNVHDGPDDDESDDDESDDDDVVESRRIESLDDDCFVHCAEATHIVDRGMFSAYRPRPTCAKGTPVEKGKSSNGEEL